jgi:hypothetical protein
MHTRFWVESPKGRDHSEDQSINGRIILEWILEILGGKLCTRFIWLSKQTSGGSCEHGNEPSGYIKGRELLD